MTDLSDRLRRNGEIAGNAGRACNLYFEAADEIDRLTAELDDARASEEGALAILAQIIAERDAERAHADMLAEALREIANCGQSAEPDHWKFRCMAREKARAALAAYEARRKG